MFGRSVCSMVPLPIPAVHDPSGTSARDTSIQSHRTQGALQLMAVSHPHQALLLSLYFVHAHKYEVALQIPVIHATGSSPVSAVTSGKAPRQHIMMA